MNSRQRRKKKRAKKNPTPYVDIIDILGLEAISLPIAFNPTVAAQFPNGAKILLGGENKLIGSKTLT